MKTLRTWACVAALATVSILTVVPDSALARGPRGGGHHAPAPRLPRMPHVSSAARQYRNVYRPRTNSSMQRRVGPVTQPRRAYVARRPRTNSYIRRHASSNRAIQGIIHQLRSIHSSLAYDIHDYKGHRASAANSVSMAIRHLSHSSYSQSRGGALTLNTNGNTTGNSSVRRTGNSGTIGNKATRRTSLTQAQSDSRVRRSMQRLSHIGSQLRSSGSTSNHSRALHDIQRAHRQLAIALQVR